jgi:2'-5' RNA ligase
MSASPPASNARRTRGSAIDVCLPELAGLLDRWRVPTVAVASRGVPPHITLLYPWRPAPLRPADIAAATAAVAGSAPFTLALRRLGRFPGILFLRPEPDDALRSLIRRLAAAFPDTPPYGGRFADPIPHLTVATAPTEEALDRLEAEIAAGLRPALPLALAVREIALEEEGEDGGWSVCSTIALIGGVPE